MSRRPRGRGRKPQHNNNKNPNRSLDSNGPDVRVRGSAKTIYDKYTSLAHDAAVSGHRVKAENYLQHAEHYFRILQEIQEKAAAKAELHQKEQARLRAQRQEQQQAGKNADESQDSQESQGDSADKPVNRPRSYLNRRRPTNGQAFEADTNDTTDDPGVETAKKAKKPASKTPASKKSEKPKKPEISAPEDEVVTAK